MSESPISITGQVPDKTMGRLGEAVADLISPITETTGLIGDSIRHHRENMAHARVTAALEKARQLQLPVQKAPFKFVTGWLEAATIENEDSPLNELWENLLLSGITNYSSYLETFAVILRQFGGSEVTVLRELARKHGQFDVGAHLIPQKAAEDDFPTFLLDVVQSDADGHIIWRDLQTKHDGSGSLGYHILGCTFIENSGKGFCYHPLYESNFVAFELLTRERLIQVNKARANGYASGLQGPHPNRIVELVWCELTQLGIEFVKACMHPERRVAR